MVWPCHAHHGIPMVLYIHTYIHTYMHVYTHTYMHVCMYVCMHVYIHTHIHVYTHVYSDTQVYTFWKIWRQAGRKKGSYTMVYVRWYGAAPSRYTPIGHTCTKVYTHAHKYILFEKFGGGPARKKGEPHRPKSGLHHGVCTMVWCGSVTLTTIYLWGHVHIHTRVYVFMYTCVYMYT